ncbi:GNAT family N-acetyltransferase [Salibacterium qingdaonense]|uniref:Protein N-acetyltransferase, RimJ/RimL family n=1 Tax=Salibacterium qingdaonense TaxID=266892 RepID=A0A1I4I727_9BACI|nr:GNAT family protein [Salibacterium qingdaonense]SFL50070.1 Protein N-acetyltransferase, RimJ/RimL family [Salibacterium qingdaonense]
MEFIPFSKEHYEQLKSWIPDGSFLMQWGGPEFCFPLNNKQLDRYVNGDDQPGLERIVYSVMEEQAVIGHISLGAVDRQNRSARIGKVLVGDRHSRGRGIGLQMMEKLCSIAFDEMKLHRVSLGVWDFNEAAVRCYERAGFVHEGRKRDIRIVRGEYWSIYEMSMLESEWEEKKKAFLR